MPYCVHFFRTGVDTCVSPDFGGGCQLSAGVWSALCEASEQNASNDIMHSMHINTHRNYVESRGEAAEGARAMACDKIVDASVQIRTRGAHATRTYKTLTKRHLSDESEFDPSP